MLNLEWTKKQELKKRKAEERAEQWKRDHPSEQELRDRRLAEEAAKWKRESERERRKERLGK